MSSKAYRADYEAAREAVYSQHGEHPNPFEEASRKHRLFYKIQNHYWAMESRDPYSTQWLPKPVQTMLTKEKAKCHALHLHLLKLMHSV